MILKKTTFSKSATILKSVLLYSALFLIVTYSNSFKSLVLTTSWIFGVAFFVGLFHHGNIKRGVFFFLIPFVGIMILAQSINYQAFWSFELIAICVGFFYGLSVRDIRSNIVGFILSSFVLVFAIIGALNYKYYEFDFHTSDFSTSKNKTFGNNKVTLVQFSHQYCGSCKKQIEFLGKFLDSSEFNNVSVVGVFVPGTNDSITGYKKFEPFFKHDFTFKFDINSKLADEFNVTSFPVLFVFSKDGKASYRIEGFQGDMVFAYEKRLIELIRKADNLPKE